MKKAQSLIEVTLLFGLTVVVSLVLLGIYHNYANSTKLTDLSKVTIRK